MKAISRKIWFSALFVCGPPHKSSYARQISNGKKPQVKFEKSVEIGLNKILANPFHYQIRYKSVRIAFWKGFHSGFIIYTILI
jgi:hypothetical protein